MATACQAPPAARATPRAATRQPGGRAFTGHRPRPGRLRRGRRRCPVSTRPSGWRVVVLGALLAAGGAWQAVAILVLLAAVLWAGEITGALVRAAGAVRERARRRRELDLRLLDLQAALELQAQALPAPCAHEQAVPVPAIGGNVVAWLCPQCDTQLPQDFSTLQEAR